MQRVTLRREPRLDPKHQAFGYQAEAVNAIRDLQYAAVFHEQGLGKTKIAVDLALYWLERRDVDTVLFVVKKGLVRNWQKELAAHTFITPKVLTQNRHANFFVFNSPARIMIAHYEILKTEKERIALFLATRDVAVVLDEAAKIKNPDSEITTVLFQLAPLFKKRVIMTGTPVANRPYDIWAQIYFLDQGASLGGDFAQFKHSTDLSSDLADSSSAQAQFEACLQHIFAKTSAFSVRQTKSSGIISLPEKVIQGITTTWETHQFELYRQLRDDLRAVVVRNGMPSQETSEELLKRLVRLLQIAANPRLVDSGYSREPGKLPFLLDIVGTVRSKNEKCIVWTSYTQNADWLARELRGFGTCRVHGKLSIVERNKSIESFISKEDIGVLVATPGAAKEGLTLTVANHVIFYDRSFSLDDYLQAQDRIHRISQERTCYVYNLIMEDSIDEWVDVLLHSKQMAAQLAQGDITLAYFRSQMSYSFNDVLKSILKVD